MMIRNLRIEIDELILEEFDGDIDPNIISGAIKEKIRSMIISRPDNASELTEVDYDSDIESGAEIQLDNSRSASLHISDVDGGWINLSNNSHMLDNGESYIENAKIIGNQIGNSVFTGMHMSKSKQVK